MNYASTTRSVTASHALASERAAFIRRTYMHLGGAIALLFWYILRILMRLNRR